MICSLAIISAQLKGNPNMNFFGFNRSSSSQTNTLQTIDAQTLKPLSTFDPKQIPQSQNQKIVLYCRSGQRSTTALNNANTL